MYTRLKGGLKVGILCASMSLYFDFTDGDNFSFINALVAFLGAFVAYEALGLIGTLLKKKLDS
ncbi:hypothetical protein OR573_03490 [Halomonas sp. CH40]